MENENEKLFEINIQHMAKVFYTHRFSEFDFDVWEGNKIFDKENFDVERLFVYDFSSL